MSTRNKRRRDGRSTSSSRDEQFELLNQKVAELQQEVSDLKKRKIMVSPGNEERYDEGFERRKEKWLRQRFGRFRFGNSFGSDNEEKFSYRRLANELVPFEKRSKIVSPRNEETYDEGFERRKEKWLRQRFGHFRFGNSSGSDNEERFSCRRLANELVPFEKRSKVKRDPSLEKASVQSRLRRVYSPPLPPYRPEEDERESFEDQSYLTKPKLRSEIRCTYSDDVLRCFYCKIRGHMSNVCWFRLRDLGYETPLDYLGYERRESRSRVRDL